MSGQRTCPYACDASYCLLTPRTKTFYWWHNNLNKSVILDLTVSILYQASEESIISHLVEHRLLPTANPEDIAVDFRGQSASPCPCCLGYLQPSALEKLAVQVSTALQKGITPLPGEDISSVQLILNLPVTFDVLRISVRTILTRVPEKTDPFPSFAELMFRLLSKTLQRTSSIKAVEDAASNQVFSSGSECLCV